MGKLKYLPHKYLFYFGFITVFLFIGLSFWQFNRYQNNEYHNYEKINMIDIHIDDINKTPVNSYVNLEGNFQIVDYYKLRSRVQNGISGYHVIAVYSFLNDNSNQKSIYENPYLVVNLGWIPLEHKSLQIGDYFYFNSSLVGFLLNYDEKTRFGQDDELGSYYLYRIDKNFIEMDQKYINYILDDDNFELMDKYLHLTGYSEYSGNIREPEFHWGQIELASLNTEYRPPHISYSIQWLFFAICLTIVILRKNKLL